MKNIDDFKNNNFKYRIWGKQGSYLKSGIIRQDGFSKSGGIAELSSGIADIDGDLIYENDFIQSSVDEFPYLVTFEEGEFVAVEQDGVTDVMEPLSDVSVGCSVVGNIHENKDMLEVEE